MGDLEESVGDCVVRSFDISNLNTIVGELDTPSCMAVGQVLRFFKELETDVIGVIPSSYVGLVRRRGLHSRRACRFPTFLDRVSGIAFGC